MTSWAGREVHAAQSTCSGASPPKQKTHPTLTSDLSRRFNIKCIEKSTTLYIIRLGLGDMKI